MTTKTLTNKFNNAANPNPQGKNPKYVGVRTMNNTLNEYKDNLEGLKFSKKMVFGRGESNHDVLAHHLEQMREKKEKVVVAKDE